MVALVFLGVVGPGVMAQDLSGRYVIRSLHGCSNDDVAQEFEGSFPGISMRTTRLASVEYPARASDWGCDEGLGWCGAGPSSDRTEGDSHDMASVEFGDRSVWKVQRVKTGPNKGRYIIEQKNGCIVGLGCPMLSWDWNDRDSHPMASVEFGDFEPWEIAKGRRDNGYIIKSKYGCDDSNDPTWCDAELSWDGRKPHPMASVEF